jgi:hypothetical protein
MRRIKDEKVINSRLLPGLRISIGFKADLDPDPGI